MLAFTKPSNAATTYTSTLAAIRKDEKMKFRQLTILFLLLGTVVYGQSSDTIKIRLTAGQEIIRGATLTIKDLNPPTGTTTDMNGFATLIIPVDKDLVEISLLGPYVRLKIERPTDSIYFDLNSKKATFFSDKKKVKTKKQIVSGY